MTVNPLKPRLLNPAGVFIPETAAVKSPATPCKLCPLLVDFSPLALYNIVWSSDCFNLIINNKILKVI